MFCKVVWNEFVGVLASCVLAKFVSELLDWVWFVRSFCNFGDSVVVCVWLGDLILLE